MSTWAKGTQHTATFTHQSQSTGGGLWVISVLPWQLALPWQTPAGGLPSWSKQTAHSASWSHLSKEVG